MSEPRDLSFSDSQYTCNGPNRIAVFPQLHARDYAYIIFSLIALLVVFTTLHMLGRGIEGVCIGEGVHEKVCVTVSVMVDGIAVGDESQSSSYSCQRGGHLTSCYDICCSHHHGSLEKSVLSCTRPH